MCNFAEINIHAPHKPEGLLPVIIQSLFINCNIFFAVSSTSLAFDPKLNLQQNLCMNIEGSSFIRIFMLIIYLNNFTNLIYKEPIKNKFILKTSEKSINKCSVFLILQAKYKIAPTIKSVFLPWVNFLLEAIL